MPSVTEYLDEDSASMRVVDFLATRLDEDPAELEPLGYRIDPDALDRLVETLTDDEYVYFEYADVGLLVWGDGDVTSADD